MQAPFFDRIKALSGRSAVCVGLDPVPDRLPKCFPRSEPGLLEFNKAIIDATSDLVCAYKPQIAFYSACGAENALQETIRYIHERTEVPVILDAKRGDIADTAEAYATEAFRRYEADAVTVNPYLGGDAIKPFTRHADRGVFVLCRTSNPGGAELQHLRLASNYQSNYQKRRPGRASLAVQEPAPKTANREHCRREDSRMERVGFSMAPVRPPENLHEQVAVLVRDEWNRHGNLGLVVGATAPDALCRIRQLAPDLPVLVPGAGAQGGDLRAVMRANGGGPILVNSARAIIYASSGADFAERARDATESLRLATLAGRPR